MLDLFLRANYRLHRISMCAYGGASECAYSMNSAAGASGSVGGPPSPPAAAAQASVKWSPPCST